MDLGDASASTSTRSTSGPTTSTSRPRCRTARCGCYVMGERGAKRRAGDRGRHRGDGPSSAATPSPPVRSASRRRARSTTARAGVSPTPTLTAAADELVGIADALWSMRRGVLEVVSDFGDLDAEFATMRHGGRRRAARSRSRSRQSPRAPDDWSVLARPHRRGRRRRPADPGPGRDHGPSVCCSVLQATVNPFCWRRPYRGDPQPARSTSGRAGGATIRRALIDRHGRRSPRLGRRLASIGKFDRMFELGDPPDYEPDPSTSVGAAVRCARGGPRRPRLRPACSPTTAEASSTCPLLNWVDGSLDAVGGHARRPASSPGSPTAARTSARSATPASRRRCSPTGARDRPTALPVEWVVARSAATPPTPSGCTTGACSLPATGPT